LNPLARRIEVEPPRLAARRHGERDVDAAGAAGGDGVAHEAAAVKFQPALGRAMPEAQPGSAAAVLTANVGPATEVVVAAAAQQRQREGGVFDRFARWQPARRQPARREERSERKCCRCKCEFSLHDVLASN
jgi:hypothetical protein